MPSRVERRWRWVLPVWLQRSDLRLFRAVAGWHAPLLDRVLPRLTRSANRSVLWLVIAALLGLSGRRSGRRAGLRGVIAIGITSAVTNLPAKLAFRRARPDSTIVPLARRLRRMPTSTSFPSGHSASAAAFATAVAMEAPVAAPVVGALASGVAFSRIYTGAHYPGDVLAGVAIGVGLALGTTRVWPRSSDEPAVAPRAYTPVASTPAAGGEGLAIVVNGSAGPALSRNPTDALREALPGAEVIELDDGARFGETLASAVERARALGAAGGDGSVNAAAEIAHRARKPLLVVPNGTLNHFARDIGIGSTDDAIDAVREGHTVAVDLALIDGKPFLNTASFGAYPELVDLRERLEGRFGKWPSLLVALVSILRNHEPVEVEINGRRRRVWTIFVGNCRYEPRGFAPSTRPRLDDGVFDVRMLLAEKPFALTRLLGAALTGRLESCSVYEERTESELKVRSLNGPLRLARDGETFDGSEAFTIAKAQEPLAVYVPARG